MSKCNAQEVHMVVGSPLEICDPEVQPRCLGRAPWSSKYLPRSPHSTDSSHKTPRVTLVPPLTPGVFWTPLLLIVLGTTVTTPVQVSVSARATHNHCPLKAEAFPLLFLRQRSSLSPHPDHLQTSGIQTANCLIT